MATLEGTVQNATLYRTPAGQQRLSIIIDVPLAADADVNLTDASHGRPTISDPRTPISLVGRAISIATTNGVLDTDGITLAAV